MASLSDGFNKLAHWAALQAGRASTFRPGPYSPGDLGCERPDLSVVRHLAADHQYWRHDRHFLMVFLIQNTQNRDTEALQLKLDELIRANDSTRNRLLQLEELTEEEMEHIKKTFIQLAKTAPPLTDEQQLSEPRARR